MLDAGRNVALCRTVASQLIDNHHTRRVALSFDKLSHQTLGGLGIAVALHRHVENEATLIDSQPDGVANHFSWETVAAIKEITRASMHATKSHGPIADRLTLRCPTIYQTPANLRSAKS